MGWDCVKKSGDQSPHAKGVAATTDRFSTLCGFVAIAIWSTTVAVARSLSEQVGPVTAGAAVYTLGGLFVAAAGGLGGFRSLRASLRLPGWYLAGCGTLFACYTAAFFLALGLAGDRTEAMAVGLWNYLWPALTVLFSAPLLGVRLCWPVVPGTLLSLAGVVLVLAAGSTDSWHSLARTLAANPPAYGLAFLAAVSWALYSNLARRWAGASAGGAVPLFILASGLILLGLRGARPEPMHWTWRTAAEVAFMGLTVVLSYACWDRAMRRGNLVLVSACSYLTPLLSTVVSCLYLRVVPGWPLWLGAGCIVAGAAIVATRGTPGAAR